MPVLSNQTLYIYKGGIPHNGHPFTCTATLVLFLDKTTEGLSRRNWEPTRSDTVQKTRTGKVTPSYFSPVQTLAAGKYIVFTTGKTIQLKKTK